MLPGSPRHSSPQARTGGTAVPIPFRTAPAFVGVAGRDEICRISVWDGGCETWSHAPSHSLDELPPGSTLPSPGG